MMFDEAFNWLMVHEGGLVNNPFDPGGKTKWGISQRAFPNVDIEKMTIDECKALYRSNYWDAVQADQLPAALRFDVFDAAVNSGVGQAAKWLQRAVGAQPDGVIGAKTISAARGADAGAPARFNGLRLQFMTDLPTWASFSRGWARRIAGNLQRAQHG